MRASPAWANPRAYAMHTAMPHALTAAKHHAGLLATVMAVCILIGETFSFHARLATAGFPWLGWDDQHHYFVDAQAWSHGNFDPALHHYLPGYGLLAAGFVKLLPWQPFLIPDLLACIACLLLFTRLCGILVPATPAWRAAAPALFAATTIGSPTLRHIWLVPWSSTGSAPFAFAALLATLHATRAPSPPRVLLLGALLGAAAGLRPSDAAILAICCTGFLGTRFFCTPPEPPPWRLAAALAAGVLLGAAPWLAAHIAAHGLAPGTYIGRMSAMGFEPRLLPLRWVELALDSRPLMAEGPGLAGAYPWIAVGIPGLLLACVQGGTARPAWRLIAAAIVLHWAVYLCYRDLHPQGLWRFSNLHYFKWTFPFLALAALRLAATCTVPAQRSAAVLSLAASLPLFLWRPTLRREASPALSPPATLIADLTRIDHAAILPITGTWHDIYFSGATLAGGDRTFHSQLDFKLIPYTGGALLIPLRELSPPPQHVDPGPAVALRAHALGQSATQGIEFGLPCMILPRRASCASLATVPQ